MDDKKTIKISVRELVEFALKSGDIASGFYTASRAVQGTRLHQKLQKSMGEGYAAEVPVTFLVEEENFDIEISGRIDGIMTLENGTVIHEIKTTYTDPDTIDIDYNPSHIAQVRCYAFIYCTQNNIEEVDIQLTYLQVETEKLHDINEHRSKGELKEIFDDYIGKYIEWAKMEYGWMDLRDSSIKSAGFPYQEYRKGQRELAVSVYRSIRDKNKLFAQAPTGIGKTAAVLFPALKALSEGLTSKIFYLTAKTTTGAMAEKTIDAMRNNGLRVKSLIITAKDKVCPNPETECDGHECRFAQGYYDRINDAIKDIFACTDSFNRETILEYAEKYSVCPFEFSLDLSIISDCIICDYNYVFDPGVYLKRFFAEGGDYCFLVDEAHNLVDRAREMYSAELNKKTVLELKKSSKSECPDIYKNVKEINDYFIKLRKECEKLKKEQLSQSELPDDLIGLLREFISCTESITDRIINPLFKQQLLDFYFNVSAFIKISEFYSEKYTFYINKENKDIQIKIFCIDPSSVMANVLKRGKASVFFSATLSPIDYFIYMLGGDKDSKIIKLPSPFPGENLCLMLDNRISTKYNVREQTYSKVSEYISVICQRTGNYLAFFPSYKYMYEVYNRFIESNSNINVICQNASMSEDERCEFLDKFKVGEEKSLVGFAVMGGIFGEGIDLKGELLSGAVIVGVGLPQICFERDIIKNYFDEANGSGFEFSYMYPGMNRVLQAAGRVIRSEKDKGVILLIDERFSYTAYERLYPLHWKPVKIKDPYSFEKAINNFWNRI